MSSSSSTSGSPPRKKPGNKVRYISKRVKKLANLAVNLPSALGGGGSSSSSGSSSTSPSTLVTSVPVSSQRAAPAVAIDLVSTLSRFGPAGASLDSLLSAALSSHTPAAFLHELEARKALTSDELRAFVTRNHSAFVLTSKQVASLESEMSHLSGALDAFVLSASDAPSMSFVFHDEKMFKRADELDQARRSQMARAVDSQAAADAQNEQLRTLIYERQFERAVSLLELKASSRSLASEARRTQLIDALCTDLLTSSSLTERQSVALWLARLDASMQAMRAFLEQRAQQIRAAARKIRPIGEPVAYAHELMRLTVGLLVSAVQEASALFGQAAARQSEIVLWCRGQLRQLAAHIAQQGLTTDLPILAMRAYLIACFEALEGAKLLGLQLEFAFAELLHDPVLEFMRRYFAQTSREIQGALAEEQWNSSAIVVNSLSSTKRRRARTRTLRLTFSASVMYDWIVASSQELLSLLQHEGPLSALYPVMHELVVAGIIGQCMQYFDSMERAFVDGIDTLTDAQCLSIAANAFYLADDLLPRLSTEFRHCFGRVVPELETLGHRLGRLYDQLLDTFCRLRAQLWLRKVLDFDTLAVDVYANPHAIDYSPLPSQTDNRSISARSSTTKQNHASLVALGISAPWAKLHDHFVALRACILTHLNTPAVQPIISACAEELLRVVIDQPMFDVGQTGEAGETTASTIGWGGLLSLTRDISFFVLALQDFDDQGHYLMELKSEALDRARLAYIRAMGTAVHEDEVSAEQEKHECEVESLVNNKTVMSLHSLLQLEAAESISKPSKR